MSLTRLIPLRIRFTHAHTSPLYVRAGLVPCRSSPRVFDRGHFPRVYNILPGTMGRTSWTSIFCRGCSSGVFLGVCPECGSCAVAFVASAAPWLWCFGWYRLGFGVRHAPRVVKLSSHAGYLSNVHRAPSQYVDACSE